MLKSHARRYSRAPVIGQSPTLTIIPCHGGSEGATRHCRGRRTIDRHVVDFEVLVWALSSSVPPAHVRQGERTKGRSGEAPDREEFGRGRVSLRSVSVSRGGVVSFDQPGQRTPLIPGSAAAEVDRSGGGATSPAPPPLAPSRSFVRVTRIGPKSGMLFICRRSSQMGAPHRAAPDGSCSAEPRRPERVAGGRSPRYLMGAVPPSSASSRRPPARSRSPPGPRHRQQSTVAIQWTAARASAIPAARPRSSSTLTITADTDGRRMSNSTTPLPQDRDRAAD